LGVYAGRCAVDGQTYAAAIHLGPNPTFAEERTKVEVHLLDFAGDLYGRVLDVDFLARVRPVQKFASVDALRAQLERDVASVRKLAAAVG
jgi:riboflavin kinase/FMN adenylyltransferase